MQSDTQHVVVVGGGYAGIMAANRLAGRRDVSVTLVEPRARFVERIRLHEFAAGSRDDATVAWQHVLSPRVTRVQARASRVDAAARVVQLDSGREIRADYLVLATGSATTAPAGLFSLSTLEQAQRLRDALEEAVSTSSEPVAVTVTGGGLTGVEAAAEIAEQYGERVRVTLATRQLLPGFSTRGRRHVERALARLNVTVSIGGHHEEQATGGIRVWSGGFAAVAPETVTGVEVDESGRIRVGPSLQALGSPRTLVAGDCAHIDDPRFAHVRMGCAAGLPLGATAAATIGALIDGRTPAPYSSGYFGQCASLGRKAGVIQLVSADDSPRAIVLTGSLGAWVKEFICRATVRWMHGESKRPGSVRFPAGTRQMRAATTGTP